MLVEEGLVALSSMRLWILRYRYKFQRIHKKFVFLYFGSLKLSIDNKMKDNGNLKNHPILSIIHSYLIGKDSCHNWWL